jgi:serine/threonine protein kinase
LWYGHIMLSVTSPMSAPDPLQPGDPTQVGAYRLLGRLGAGGMGQVYLGVSRGGRKVAVKVLRADLVTDAEFRTRFAREVAAARTVNGFYTAPVVDADPVPSQFRRRPPRQRRSPRPRTQPRRQAGPGTRHP